MPLCLPPSRDGEGEGVSGAASPAPSSRSAGSEDGRRKAVSLSGEYRSRHYLAGLLLADLTSALELQYVDFLLEYLWIMKFFFLFLNLEKNIFTFLYVVSYRIISIIHNVTNILLYLKI